jgi:hypothetical protein
MIEIKKYNYFTGDNPNQISQGIYEIVKFLELTGLTYLLITPDYIRGKSILHHHFDNKISFKDLSDFIDILSDKSNFFRLDLVVFDFWSLSKADFWYYKEEILKLDLKYFIVSREYGYSDSEDVNDFIIRREYRLDGIDNHSEIWLTDKIDKTTVSLDSLKKSYIRDKKIGYLFGDSENF